MTLTYETEVQANGEHECKLKFEDDVLEIRAGYYSDNVATITLEQFDQVAKEVATYRQMVALANGKDATND